MTTFSELIKKVLNLYVGHFKFILALLTINLLWNLALLLIPVSFATTIRYMIPVSIASLVIMLFTELALTSGLSSIVAGSPIPAHRAFLTAAKYLPWFLILFVIWLAVVVVGGLFLIVPGVIFATWFMFLGAVVVLEGRKGLGAFKRSKHLVYGHTINLFLRVFIVGFVLLAISEIAGRGFMYVVNLVSPASAFTYLVSIGQFFTAILSIVIFPILTATVVTLYFEMKKLKG